MTERLEGLKAKFFMLTFTLVGAEATGVLVTGDVAVGAGVGVVGAGAAGVGVIAAELSVVGAVGVGVPLVPLVIT